MPFCCLAEDIEGVTVGAGEGWRLGVVGDSLVSRYMIRDTDSPILTREVDAVRHWLSSGTVS